MAPPLSMAVLLKRINKLEHALATQQKQIDQLSNRLALYWKEEGKAPSFAIVLEKYENGLADLLCIGEDWSGGITCLRGRKLVDADEPKHGRYEPMVVPLALLQAADWNNDLDKQNQEPADGNSALEEDESSASTPALIS